jgi:hypothetical protein
MSSSKVTVTPGSRKLEAFLATHTPGDVHRLTGVRQATVRFLAAGLSRPNAATMERLRGIGIECADWFLAEVQS